MQQNQTNYDLNVLLHLRKKVLSRCNASSRLKSRSVTDIHTYFIYIHKTHHLHLPLQNCMTDKVVLRRTSKAIIVKRLVQFLKEVVWLYLFLGPPSGRPIKVYQAIRTVLRREICNSIYEEGNSVSSRGPKRISLCIHTTQQQSLTEFGSRHQAAALPLR